MFRSICIIALLAILTSCSEEGCTDLTAENYSPSAEKNDGSCLYIEGCADATALNYDPQATKHSYDCEYLGSVLFYTSPTEDPDCGRIRISMDDEHQGDISRHTPSDSLNCDHSGGVRLTLGPGEYNYVAHAEWGCKWYGTITITSRQCLLEQIEP